jgi:hypothetical protein
MPEVTNARISEPAGITEARDGSLKKAAQGKKEIKTGVVMFIRRSVRLMGRFQGE